jgi:hypothetical protein
MTADAMEFVWHPVTNYKIVEKMLSPNFQI